MYLDVAEVAELLTVSIQRVYQLIDDDRIPFERYRPTPGARSSRRLRIEKGVFEKWLRDESE